MVRVRFGVNVGRNKCQRGDGIDGDDGELSEGRVVEQRSGSGAGRVVQGWQS